MFHPCPGRLALPEQEVPRLWRWGASRLSSSAVLGTLLVFPEFPGWGPLPGLGPKFRYPFTFLRTKSEVPEGAKADAHSGVGRDRFLGQLG